MISEVPNSLADDHEQRPLRLHTPTRTYSWPHWSDLVDDLESSAKIRGLVLAVNMEEPGENLLQAQAIARAVNARLEALDALRECAP